MLAAHTHTHSLSFHSSLAPTTRPCSLSSSRPALADSTNTSLHSACNVTYSKSCVYPTSSTRTSCGWNDFEPPPTPHPTSVQSRPPALSPFSVTYKAPPTVSVSLSAACSQSIPGGRARSARVQGLELDLLDVRSVVPFPTTPLDGDMDVEMFDGRCLPCSDSHPAQTPRKRHSAQSSVSSSPTGLLKDVKPKRPRKSKRQVAELWWLGVVHRSILRGIEVRQSDGELDAPDRLSARSHDLDAMDRLLAEKIQRRLADNGCVDGRALPNPLPRISSPSISVPSLNLVAPSRKNFSTGSPSFTIPSELNSTIGCGVLDGTVTPLTAAPKPTPRASLSIASPPSPSYSPSTSHRRHVRFETQKRLRTAPLHPSVPRRSPSPPARTGSIPVNGQMLTLTMPQLVASLKLAYRERSGLRPRGRTYKVTAEYTKNAGRFLLSEPSTLGGVSCGDEAVALARARLSSVPERKSPLSRVAYVES